MKNKIFILGIILIALVSFNSCKDITTEGVTGITYYPDIVMAGSPTVYIEKGSTYTDAGASATENGTEIEVTVSSDVDASTPGSYSVGYTAYNSDGFSKTVNRYVYVYDGNMSTEDISGTYTGHVIRDNNPAKEYGGNPVTLTATNLIPGATGIYEITDWIAGFYSIGYAYGSNYAFSGIIQINGDNEVVLISQKNIWGDPIDEPVVGSYDPATHMIVYDFYWAGYDFAVDLTKK